MKWRLLNGLGLILAGSVIFFGLVWVGWRLIPDSKVLSSDNSGILPTPVVTRSTPRVKTTLIFGGDVMLGRQVEVNMDRYGSTWPLQKLASTLKSASFTIVNLESPFKRDAPTTQDGSLVLRGDPKGVDNLTEGGVDLVSLANNHIPDMGLVGLQQTQQILTQNKIKFVGAGQSLAQAQAPQILIKNGLKIGFLSYTYGVNHNSPGVYYNLAKSDQVKKDVTKLKSQVDIVVVLAHFGTEYQAQPNQFQKDFAYAAIDAGANLVIGAHPHIPEPVEQYKNGIIIYSLGNLVFDQEEIDNRNFSALAQFTFTGKKLTQLKLLPYQIRNLGQPVLLTDLVSKQRIWQLFDLPSGQLSFPTG